MMKRIVNWLSKATPQELAAEQLDELRRELLGVQRAKEHFAGLESGLKTSIARLEHAIQLTRSVC